MAEVDRHLVLVGMMGTGKSTVGAAVAARLGRPLVDTDAVIEAGTGRTVAEIFATDGEAAFRELESEVLIDALEVPSALVIAAAGGTVLSAANRAALDRRADVVWLRCDPAILAERVRGSSHRPLLDADPPPAGGDPETPDPAEHAAAVLGALASERDALYREVADRVVDTDDLAPDAVADAVLAAIEART